MSKCIWLPPLGPDDPMFDEPARSYSPHWGRRIARAALPADKRVQQQKVARTPLLCELPGAPEPNPKLSCRSSGSYGTLPEKSVANNGSILRSCADRSRRPGRSLYFQQ